MNSLFYSVFTISSLLVVTTLNAQCVPWTGNNKTNEKKISEIRLDVQNVFDNGLPGESSKFHRSANKLKIKTQDYVVSRELLFKIGDELDMRMLEETERILRSKSFIKDAEIYPLLQCDDGVVIQVVTKDNWTLQPSISFGFTGGKSKYSFELEDKNLFGTGKSLGVKYRKGLEREQKSIEYFDPNFLNSTKRLKLIYQNNSDGKLKYFNLEDPFVALNTPNSWGVDFMDWSLINPIYDSGEIADEIGQNIKKYTFQTGKLVHVKNNRYYRLNFGLTSNKSNFFNSEQYPLTVLPAARDYQYPWVGFEFINENYIEKSNFNSMGRVEDILLGPHFTARIGQAYSDSSTHFMFDYKKGFLLSQDNFLKINSYANGIYDSGKLANSHFGFNVDWHHFQSDSKTFFVSAAVDLGKNLFAEQNQYLGGETGLRGYPFRYLAGENKFITSIEQRFFYNWYPLKTFQFASALFLDSGTVWDSGDNKKLFTNIGVGFRLVPTRTSGGQVIHFDLAIPIQSQPGLDNIQLQIRAKKSF